MSRTYRKGEIVNGKYKLTKNINKEPPVNCFRHDRPKARRALNNSRRHEEKQFLSKGWEILKYFKSRGWGTW